MSTLSEDIHEAKVLRDRLRDLEPSIAAKLARRPITAEDEQKLIFQQAKAG